MSSVLPVNRAPTGSVQLYIKVLGRTLEHLGVQMYKRREAAIAELVANAWDAGATKVEITLPLPENYDKAVSMINIEDNGSGMDLTLIQTEYLVVGRNRRRGGTSTVTLENPEAESAPTVEDAGQVVPTDESALEQNKAPQPSRTRHVMGRKGIGKLAGFGLARIVTITTWREETAFRFVLDLERLKVDDTDASDIPVEWEQVPIPSETGRSGTIIELSLLKHTSAPDIPSLMTSLARRFSRSIQGEMGIMVNSVPLPDPTPPLDFRFPARGQEETTVDGGVVRYWYGFASDVIKSRDLRGFSVLVNGKVAQAPPFFFDVETTASGQHSTKYVIGEIEADFLDAGTDDESDIVATDRQEIDWEAPQAIGLLAWGKTLARRVMADCRDYRGKKLVAEIYVNPELRRRIERLEPTSRAQIHGFLEILGLKDSDDDNLKLADALVRAYEFRQFHDVISEIEAAAEDPNQLARFLGYLGEWKTLESRAILELVSGRLEIIERFESLIINDAPETANQVGANNMHDAIAGFPWLLSPDWQVFAEEKTITKQLREWGDTDIDSSDRDRYDFLALDNGQKLILVEIKRSDHPVTYEETSRAIKYREKLQASRPDIYVVLIYGGSLAISDKECKVWEDSEDRELRKWSEVFETSRRQYERYKAVLSLDAEHRDFATAEGEVARTRSVLATDSFYRGTARAGGLGVSDPDYSG